MLFEGRPRPGTPPRWEGLTDTYVRVQVAADDTLTNALLPVRVTGEAGETLTGALLGAVTP